MFVWYTSHTGHWPVCTFNQPSSCTCRESVFRFYIPSVFCEEDRWKCTMNICIKIMKLNLCSNSHVNIFYIIIEQKNLIYMQIARLFLSTVRRLLSSCNAQFFCHQSFISSGISQHCHLNILCIVKQKIWTETVFLVTLLAVRQMKNHVLNYVFYTVSFVVLTASLIHCIPWCKSKHNPVRAATTFSTWN